MTDLDKKRLLLLASGSADHKRHYSKYCELSQEGLTSWALGHAYLTPAGQLELERLQGEQDD